MSDPQENIELTILMPCLNESETLATCIQKARKFLKSNGIIGEILIADNGSVDGSQDIAKSLGARVVDVKEKGYGAALIGGIAEARGLYTIMGDADDSYDFLRLEGFMDKLRDGYDFVIGNRFKGGIEPGAMPFLNRRLGTPVLSWLGRIFFKIPAKDFNCGLRGFRTDKMRGLRLKTLGMEFASEMLVKSVIRGLRVIEVPTTLRKDGRSRAPHLRRFRDGWRHLCFLLALTPQWVFIYPGALLSFVGLFFTIILSCADIRIGSVSLGIKSLIVGCLFLLVGAQAIGIGTIMYNYAVNMNILSPSKRSGRIFSLITRNRIIVLSAGLFIFGTLLGFYCFYVWAVNSFGPMHNSVYDKLIVISTTLIAMAISIFQQAFVYEILSFKGRR